MKCDLDAAISHILPSQFFSFSDKNQNFVIYFIVSGEGKAPAPDTIPGHTVLCCEIDSVDTLEQRKEKLNAVIADRCKYGKC